MATRTWQLLPEAGLHSLAQVGVSRFEHDRAVEISGCQGVGDFVNWDVAIIQAQEAHLLGPMAGEGSKIDGSCT
jgi:hypothetical protein